MIDTHSHIYEPEFEDDLAETVQRAVAAGVDRFVLPAIDSASYERMMNTVSRLDGMAYPCIGLHPTSVDANWEREYLFFEEKLEGGSFSGIGEIGLDGHWSRDFMAQQIEVLERSMRVAYRKGLPVILHVRDASEELFDVLGRLKSEGSVPCGVFHAFSGSMETYLRIKSYGDFLFGIGGVVTFKNAQLARTVSKMPLEDMLLETDCPWLAPVPHRGTRNEPSYLVTIAEKIADLTGRSLEDVEIITTRNAERLFLFQ